MPYLLSAIWFGLLLLFSILEAATVNLVSLWFAAGALSALLVSFLTADLWLQIGLFLLVSALTLILFRPMASKLLIPRHVATNADRVIGQEAQVVEIINNLKSTGAVCVLGLIWTARSSTENVIPAGQTVRVDRIEGVKLFVSPLPSAATVCGPHIEKE